LGRSMWCRCLCWRKELSDHNRCGTDQQGMLHTLCTYLQTWKDRRCPRHTHSGTGQQGSFGRLNKCPHLQQGRRSPPHGSRFSPRRRKLRCLLSNCRCCRSSATWKFGSNLSTRTLPSHQR